MHDVSIRRYTPGDEPGIVDLIVPIQREEFGIPISADDQPDLMDIAAFYQTGTGDFWIALGQGKVIGTVALKDIGHGDVALRKMFVDAAWRGREHGIANRLLDTLIDAAQARGLKRIYLGTTDKFLAAHRFYERRGFELIEQDALPATFPRMAVDTRFYALNL